MSITVTAQKNGATIAVRAQPGAKKTGVVGVWNGMLKVAVSAPPEDGRANAALVEVLREFFRLPRSRVELLSGASNRNKVFLLHGLTDADVEARLTSAGLWPGGS
jgi:uncharacterized protein (TIGR00251 family)